MITPMKKVYLLSLKDERDKTLRALRELGVVHIQESQHLSTDAIVALKRDETLLQSALSALEDHNKADMPVSTETLQGPELQAKAEELINAAKQIEASKAHILSLKQDRDAYAPFGDFDEASVEALRAEGVSVYFCAHRTPLDIDSELIAAHDVSVQTISRKKDTTYSVVFALCPLEKLPSLPQVHSPVYYAEAIAAEEKQSAEAQALITASAQYHSALKGELDALRAELELQSVDASMLECEDEVLALEGFVPVPVLRPLRKWAEEQGVGLALRDPLEDEAVPTLVENNAFTRLLTPLYSLLGISPGYREMDVSFFFLVTLTIFTGMLMADAGYGALFAGLAFFMKKKGVQAKELGQWSPLSLLILLLSGSMIFWGTITGTWFASRALTQMVPFRYLVIPSMASYPEYFGVSPQTPQDTLVFISCLLGVIHLDLACILAILRDRGKKVMWAHVGWLSFLSGMFFVVISMLIPSIAAPVFVPVLLAIGFVLIVLFGNQEEGKSFVHGIIGGLKGLFNTVLDAIGSFSNIISYVRLFAVGVASVKIADAFNTMAAPALGGWAFPIGVVILILGHGLNVSMGLLSVLVHGARLNLLEFSGQLGIEWSGVMYKPFRIRGEQ